MTSREDFKQAIKTGNINEAFLVAMSNAPELTITTKIITAQGEKTVDRSDFEADNYLRTNINLIEGKIENEIGEKLTGERYSEIKQFHMRQVAEGHQTIQHNLVSLQKMFQLMSSFQQQQTGETSNWVDIAANVTRESLPPQPQNEQLYGKKTPSALEAGKTTDKPRTQLAIEADNIEPQLPSFEEEEEGIVDDLLSLTDIDEDFPQKDIPAEQEDWGEWLEDEPEAKPEVFDLKSLNLKDAQNLKSWDSSNPSTE